MVVVGADVHKRTHTFVAVDEVGRKLGREGGVRHQRRASRRGLWARERFGVELVWAIEDCRHLSARLERDLMAGGQKVVRVPPKMMAQTRPRRAPRASPIRLTRWRWRGHFCANPTCRSPRTTRCRENSSCWWIVVKSLWPNGLRRSTGCCGGSMNLILRARRNPARLIWPSIADCSVIGWLTSLVWSPSWPTSPTAHRGDRCVGQTYR